MAIGALPQNLPTTLHNLGVMVDEIWFNVGDASTDYNWYTKRASLLNIYILTGLYSYPFNNLQY